MHIRVRLFARQREIAGARQVELDVAEGGRIEDAWLALVERCPPLAPGRPHVRFARNGVYADADEALADGDEVACIPPVSGGESDPPDERVREIRLSAEPLDETVVAALQRAVASPADGAVVVFVGRTRQSPGTPAPGEEVEAERHAGSRVLALEYETYETMALRVLNEVASEIEARFAVRRIALVHRVGTVPLGEASVAIAVAARHRGPAFDACRYAIDELKARAPIWKSEQFADGTVWIGEPARAAPRETD